MKKVITLFTAVFALVIISCEDTEGFVTEEFTVHGNCGMCKKTIEGSLDGVDGISTAEWSMSNDKMTVFFDPKTISLADIHSKIASVGYDTDEKRAKDEVYDKLHSCCKYDRPE
ncbi:MAG: heavy-metal-associated domain-containing protein [Crocinitomicaceae bacterium]|nr:heavy-metal-associated domain-containing protein [Crocinitomicaceae bacterium]